MTLYNRIQYNAVHKFVRVLDKYDTRRIRKSHAFDRLVIYDFLMFYKHPDQVVYQPAISHGNLWSIAVI